MESMAPDCHCRDYVICTDLFIGGEKKLIFFNSWTFAKVSTKGQIDVKWPHLHQEVRLGLYATKIRPRLIINLRFG